ncbi:methyltransferase domain-containing protein [bacterium]|nr:MAG: methyltransferase domain-containing protein [bacterium]
MNPRGPLKDGDETLDPFYRGRVRVLQKRKGYRFSVDAPLLADFIRTEASDELLELGAGSGVISLLLSIKPFRHITAVEVQADLADLARRNVALNGLEDRVRIVEADLRSFDPGKTFDVVFSNPPYIRGGGGHLSRSEEKSVAKHEIKCDISDIMRKTRALLKEDGRAYFIYPEKRRKDLADAVNAHDLKLKTIRPICPREDQAANLFLAECDRVSLEKRVLPPFILYGRDGKYTAEAEAVFSGRTTP